MVGTHRSINQVILADSIFDIGYDFIILAILILKFLLNIDSEKNIHSSSPFSVYDS